MRFPKKLVQQVVIWRQHCDFPREIVVQVVCGIVKGFGRVGTRNQTWPMIGLAREETSKHVHELIKWAEEGTAFMSICVFICTCVYLNESILIRGTK